MSGTRRRIARFAVGAALAAGLALAPLAAAAAPDPWITTRVKLSLLFSEGVDGLDVNVDTQGGRVTLHGTAATASQRADAERLARQVAGVREVRNLIQVVPASLADDVAAVDERIAEQVKAALSADPGLDESRIEVKSVHQGAVLLGGEAASLTAHLRAVEIAQGIAGVRRVATQVQSPDRLADTEIWRDPDVAAAPPEARTAVNDAWLTSAAKLQLLGADLSAFDVRVDSRNGVVTLFGTVESEAEKREAEAQVKQVEGVSAVRNELQVVAPTGKAAVDRKDEEIRETVSKRLAGRDELSDADIDVQVENGVVRLTGEVESQSDRLAALTAARSSDGVRSVIGDLRVGRN